MANRETKKIKINRDRFMEVLKLRKSSIRQLDDPRNEKGIGRTEKTIRRCLKSGQMPPELLNNIARYLNIHPDYLSGVYDEKADKIEDSFLRQMYKRSITPEKYPYLLKAKSDIEYTNYFENILTMNNISIDQFRSLPPEERIIFRQELVVAILKVIAKHFKKDSLGCNIAENLDYCESFVGDLDPTSYFAELEGIGISEEELFAMNPITEEELKEDNEFKKRMDEKYGLSN